ncbi:MAG: gas vesicle protein GvpJ [Pseudomonadota bacterium]
MTEPPLTSPSDSDVSRPGERLAETLDRLLHEGVAAEADLVITLADVPLVRVSARLVAATAYRLGSQVGKQERSA